MFKFYRLIWIGVLSSGAIAATSTFDRMEYREKRYLPRTDGSCGLRKFGIATYRTHRLKSGNQGENVRTVMAAVVESTQASCLERYGVVQFIRGCMYDGYRQKDTGEVTYFFTQFRESRGMEKVPFVHPNWEVDTVDADPLYNSADPGETDRLMWYMVGKSPLVLKNTPEALAADRKIFFTPSKRDFLREVDRNKTRQFYVTDLPSGTDYVSNPSGKVDFWTNSSLEFKTCLYRLKDIPVEGDPLPHTAPAQIGGPIACFDWSERSKFDPAKNRIVNLTQSDPHCKTYVPEPEVPTQESVDPGISPDQMIPAVPHGPRTVVPYLPVH